MSKLSRRADKDLAELSDSLANKAKRIVAQLAENPESGQNLVGPLAGKCSARLGRTHRIIYVAEPEFVVLAIVQRRDGYR